MSTIYVLNKDGKPLMPTTRGGHVRHLLKEQKARVVQSNPFTIQLLYETNDVVQPLYLGIDPGRTNIGVAVVKADGTAVFAAHLETRNKKIPKLMQDRKKPAAQDAPMADAAAVNGELRQMELFLKSALSKLLLKMAASANAQKISVLLNAAYRVVKKMYFASASKTKRQSSPTAQDRKAGLHLLQISCSKHTSTWLRRFKSFFPSAMLYLKSTNLRS